VAFCALLAAAACAAAAQAPWKCAAGAAFVPGQSGKQRPSGRREAKGPEGSLRLRSASTRDSALDDAVPVWWTEQHAKALDILSFAFWALAAFLAWEHYSAKIGTHCQGSMTLGLSGQWLPNSSQLCQMVSSHQ